MTKCLPKRRKTQSLVSEKKAYFLGFIKGAFIGVPCLGDQGNKCRPLAVMMSRMTVASTMLLPGRLPRHVAEPRLVPRGRLELFVTNMSLGPLCSKSCPEPTPRPVCDDRRSGPTVCLVVAVGRPRADQTPWPAHGDRQWGPIGRPAVIVNLLGCRPRHFGWPATMGGAAKPSFWPLAVGLSGRRPDTLLTREAPGLAICLVTCELSCCLSLPQVGHIWTACVEDPPIWPTTACKINSKI